MSRPDVLQADFEKNLTFGQSPEHFLGADERDEALIATTAVLGPLATMLARTDSEPFRPVFEARPPATAAEVASTVEFVPTVEAAYPEWRDDAEARVAGAAIMFAWERPDINTELTQNEYMLAA